MFLRKIKCNAMFVLKIKCNAMFLLKIKCNAMFLLKIDCNVMFLLKIKCNVMFFAENVVSVHEDSRKKGKQNKINALCKGSSIQHFIFFFNSHLLLFITLTGSWLRDQSVVMW